MTPELKKYAQQDEWYNQFCTRYDHVSADPKTREEHRRWYLSVMYQDGIREDALRQGLEQGLEQGRIQTIAQLIHNKKLKSKTREQIIDELELDEAQIKILDNFESYTHLLV